MIFDRMERLSLYRGLNGNLDALIDFSLSHDLAALAPGKSEIDADRCWISSNVAALKPRNDVFERHMEYIDLQIPLEAGETIYVRPVEELQWPDSDDETRFTTGAGGMQVELRPGTFAIFFPGDAHNCGNNAGGLYQVRKLVGKARLE